MFALSCGIFSPNGLGCENDVGGMGDKAGGDGMTLIWRSYYHLLQLGRVAAHEGGEEGDKEGWRDGGRCAGGITRLWCLRWSHLLSDNSIIHCP